ncbi:unnamed protein product [Brachionus calyciflorus]|uniref:Glycosyltransferase family 92 protein n=1 Tax=Brachionus calyciflorus TaxID=104777 RepID=A0A813RW81_9BILA|nr:unnamed protein product [Brachionus calyciflorus]
MIIFKNRLLEIYIFGIFNLAFLSFMLLVYKDFYRVTSIYPHKEIDDDCELNGDWISLKDYRVFFKKSASYYIEDLNIMTLNFIQPASYPLKFEVFLTIKATFSDGIQKQIVHKLKNSKLTRILPDIYDGSFEYNQLDAEFNLKYFFGNQNYTNLNLLVNLREKNTASKLNKPLRLNIKKILNTNKLDKCLICSKMIVKDEYFYMKDLSFWLNLNKLSGYDRVHSYYMSSYNDKTLLDFFTKSKDFLTITKVKCLPNLINELNFKYFNQFDFIGEIMYIKMDLINELLINECYMNNVDKYKYIAILDRDEVIFPKNYTEFFYGSNIHTKMKLLIDSIDADFYTKIKELPAVDFKEIQNINESNLFNFIEEENINNEKKHCTHFPTQVYLNMGLIDKMCNSLNQLSLEPEDFFETKALGINILENFKSKIADVPFNFTIKFSIIDDFEYGYFLCKIKEEIVDPFRNKFVDDIKKTTGLFDRFFMISSKRTGKCIHNTNRTHTISTHFSKRDFHIYNEKKIRLIPSKKHNVEYSDGFTSHFRYDLKSKIVQRQIFQISDISFDYDYFNLFKNLFQ